jgi:hypothetical protein
MFFGVPLTKKHHSNRRQYRASVAASAWPTPDRSPTSHHLRAGLGNEQLEVLVLLGTWENGKKQFRS